MTEVLIDAPESVSVFCGCDNLAFESFADGAVGWISMLANVAPRDCVDLFESVYDRKDLTHGFEVYKKILPALNVLESFPKPVQALKYALKSKDLGGGYVRRPRLELSEDEKAFVDAQMHLESLK